MGTNSIKAALAEVFYDGSINILGISKVPSTGLRKGNIIDIESTAKSIDECLLNLEKLTGIEIYSAVIGFSSNNVTSVNNHAIVAVGNRYNEITAEDKERVLQSAQNIALPPDKTIVQVIERQYIIDGYDGVKDPIGMVGSRLEAEIVIIIAATAALQNLYRSTQRINLQVNNVYYNPLLASQSVLLPTEKEMGVVLINLGAGITEISFFEMGNILYTSVIPIGGDYITKDLAIVLRTSIQEAERIKEEYGTANVNKASEEDKITIRNIHGTETKQVSKRVIAEIISARVYELLEMIYAEFNRFDCIGKMPGGIVLTGGGAHLDGIDEVIEDYFKVPVRLGYPDNIQGLPPEYRYPQYANVLGAIQCGAKNLDISYQETQGIFKVLDRISYYFKDLFS